MLTSCTLCTDLCCSFVTLYITKLCILKRYAHAASGLRELGSEIRVARARRAHVARMNAHIAIVNSRVAVWTLTSVTSDGEKSQLKRIERS